MAELYLFDPLLALYQSYFKENLEEFKGKEKSCWVDAAVCYFMALISQGPGVSAAEGSHLPFPRIALIQSSTPSPGMDHIQHKYEVTKQVPGPFAAFYDISEEPSSSGASHKLALLSAVLQSTSSSHPASLSSLQVLSPRALPINQTQCMVFYFLANVSLALSQAKQTMFLSTITFLWPTR